MTRATRSEKESKPELRPASRAQTECTSPQRESELSRFVLSCCSHRLLLNMAIGSLSGDWNSKPIFHAVSAGRSRMPAKSLTVQGKLSDTSCRHIVMPLRAVSLRVRVFFGLFALVLLLGIILSAAFLFRSQSDLSESFR